MISGVPVALVVCYFYEEPIEFSSKVSLNTLQILQRRLLSLNSLKHTENILLWWDKDKSLSRSIKTGKSGSKPGYNHYTTYTGIMSNWNFPLIYHIIEGRFFLSSKMLRFPKLP